MNINIYSIYDTVAMVFNRPFYETNDGTAIRAFKNQVEKQDVDAKDYVLFRIGSYTDHDGNIVPVNPVKIYTGFDIDSDKSLKAVK